jgi:hypothetical protein
MIFSMWMTSMLAPELRVNSGCGARSPYESFLNAVPRGLRKLTLSTILADELE